MQPPLLLADESMTIVDVDTEPKSKSPFTANSANAAGVDVATLNGLLVVVLAILKAPTTVDDA